MDHLTKIFNDTTLAAINALNSSLFFSSGNKIAGALFAVASLVYVAGSIAKAYAADSNQPATDQDAPRPPGMS